MPKSFNIITLGCKVNQYESAYLKETLTDAGWHQSRNGDKPDVAIINTCIVTQKATHQSRQEIRKAIRENPDGNVAAVGCYAQVFPEELSGIKGIGLIADNTAKGKLPELVLNAAESWQKTVALKDFETETRFDFLGFRRFPDRTRAYLKIQDGCQSFCSYCIVPFARGPCRSLSFTKILSMVESLAKEGYKEIVLTGIHLGKYGVDLPEGMNLNRLLRAIGREDFPVRVRLSSLEPNEIDADLIEMAAAKTWLCRHFHIPLQSGDDRILRKMNRHYTAREFETLIRRIHDNIPFVGIGVDVMAGFPGEDNVAHENTCSFIKDLPVSYLHVFPFSRRKGTVAAAFNDQVDSKVIKKRAKDLRDIGWRKRAEFHRNSLRKEFLVLAEGWHSEGKEMMKGVSDNYLPVLFPSSQDSTNQLIPVRMERLEKDMVIGSALNSFP
jgi:threonylcarbamoyladenosine tRNA methylthiotransferase MtaB